MQINQKNKDDIFLDYTKDDDDVDNDNDNEEEKNNNLKNDNNY